MAEIFSKQDEAKAKNEKAAQTSTLGGQEPQPKKSKTLEGKSQKNSDNPLWKTLNQITDSVRPKNGEAGIGRLARLDQSLSYSGTIKGLLDKIQFPL